MDSLMDSNQLVRAILESPKDKGRPQLLRTSKIENKEDEKDIISYKERLVLIVTEIKKF